MSGKKKLSWKKIGGTLLKMLAGGCMGFLGGYGIGMVLGRYGKKMGLFTVCLLLVWAAAAVLLELIVHEAGHLMGGFLTGYEFSSFRIGSMILLKEQGKLRVKRMKLAGTLGQCLMVPPRKEKLPVVIYNLGGIFMNFLTALLGAAVCVASGNFILSLMGCLLAVIGVFMGVTNGLPLKGIIYNDGYNTRLLIKNNRAREAFRKQLLIIEQISRGVRPKDMPKEWFSLQEEGSEDGLTRTIDAFRCERLIDQGNYEEALQEILKLWGNKEMLQIHQRLLRGEGLFCELVGENRREEVDKLYDSELKAYIKAMKSNISTQRILYTYALLAEKNITKAQEYKKAFEKAAKTHPYACEVEAERELMAVAKRRS